MLRIAIVEDHESDAKRLIALLEAYAQKNGLPLHGLRMPIRFWIRTSTSMSWCLWTFGCRG